MGLVTIAEEREKEAAVFERMADDAEKDSEFLPICHLEQN
jgi:hypothetical protein